MILGSKRGGNEEALLLALHTTKMYFGLVTRTYQQVSQRKGPLVREWEL